MAMRDKMIESSGPYLRPGEPVQAVFAAQTTSQWMYYLAGVLLFMMGNKYRIIVVTPARILVLDAGKHSMLKAHGVVMELPRSTRLGPASGLWHKIPAGQETLRVRQRFFKDIAAADAALPAAA